MTYKVGDVVNIPTRSVNRCDRCGTISTIPPQNGVVVRHEGGYCATMHPQTCPGCQRTLTLYALDNQAETTTESDIWADRVAEEAVRKRLYVYPKKSVQTEENEREKEIVYVRLDR